MSNCKIQNVRDLIALGAHRSKNQTGTILGEYYGKYLQYRYTARTSFLLMISFQLSLDWQSAMFQCLTRCLYILLPKLKI